MKTPNQNCHTSATKRADASRACLQEAEGCPDVPSESKSTTSLSARFIMISTYDPIHTSLWTRCSRRCQRNGSRPAKVFQEIVQVSGAKQGLQQAESAAHPVRLVNADGHENAVNVFESLIARPEQAFPCPFLAALCPPPDSSEVVGPSSLIQCPREFGQHIYTPQRALAIAVVFQRPRVVAHLPPLDFTTGIACTT